MLLHRALLASRRAALSTAPATAAAPAPPAPLPVVPPFELTPNEENVKYVVFKDTLSSASDVTDLSSTQGVPAQYFKQRVYIHRDCANTMQSLEQHQERRSWNVRFNREGDEGASWTNQLMGWTSTGDALDRSGVCKIKFPSAEAATAFCKKMGFSNIVVADPGVPQYTKPNRTYLSNFLNEHVAAKLKTTPPRKMMRTLYAHPTKQQSAWVNLGALAVQMGTSTHHKQVKPELVSQAFWDEPSFDGDKPAHRYDNWEMHHEWTQKREK